MSLEYKPICFAGKERYKEYTNLQVLQASDYSFVNVWAWGPFHDLRWRFTEQLCWIKSFRNNENEFWAPVGDWGSVNNWEQFEEIKAGVTFFRVPEALAQIWQQQTSWDIEVQEERGQWDYLYKAEELCVLSGNRFHKKKNLLRQFQKMYSYDYQRLTMDNIPKAVELQMRWLKNREAEETLELRAEHEAILRTFEHWEEMDSLHGGLLLVDEQAVAFTIGEAFSTETLLIHFEKADIDIKGGYQAINYLYANDVGKDFVFINREQDLDSEGLRKAKMSYNPVDFVKKYTVRIRSL